MGTLIDFPPPRDLQPKKSLNALNLDFTTRGYTGLNALAGYVREDLMDQLNGCEAVEIYKRMGDYDPVCSGILYMLLVMARQVGWRVDPASSRGPDVEAADFVESCMDDMAMSWIDTISEILSFGQYGHSLHEIVYKRRCGNAPEKALRSKYADGRIGWRYLPIRSQDTLVRWDLDASGDIRGAEQRGPPSFESVYLPMSRCLLFRTRVHKNNPLGHSLLKGATTSWMKKNGLERFESIGVERRLNGLPCAWVPMDILNAQPGTEAAKTQAELKKIVSNIRADEQAGMLLPLEYDDNGRKLFDFTLLSGGDTGACDTDKIIQRHDHRMAMSMLGDFLLMGQASSSTGSLAMHQDKSGLFGRSISALLDIIQQTLQVGVARLMALNDFPIRENPQIVHDSLDSVDMDQLGKFLTSLSGAGMPLFPNQALEKRIFEIAGLPAPTDMEVPDDSGPMRLQEPQGVSLDGNVAETHDARGMEHDSPDEPTAGSPMARPHTPQELAMLNHLKQQAEARVQGARRPPMVFGGKQ